MKKTSGLLLSYLTDIHPMPKKKGRRTGTIKLVSKANKNVTFDMLAKFPGAKVIDHYMTDHHGSFFRAAISHNNHLYIWDDLKRTWSCSRVGSEDVYNLFQTLKAIVLLMNTDPNMSWSDRILQAMDNSPSHHVKNILNNQWWSLKYPGSSCLVACAFKF